MTVWKIIKLELGQTQEFSRGSPGRCYLLRLPLHGDGTIDEAECAAHPRQATVRRFWPNEADLSGYVVRKRDGWAFSYAPGEGDEGELVQLEDRPIMPGVQLTILDQSGVRLPFRVVSVDEA